MAALISYSVAGSVGSPKFICLGINFSDHLDSTQITDPSLQTNNTSSMSSGQNEGFISCIRFFLLLTLLYNIKLSQILAQILMKKLDARIFIIVNKTIYFSFVCGFRMSFWKSGKCSKRFFITKSNFEKVAYAVDGFLGILGNLQGQLYLRTAIPQSGRSRDFFPVR